MGLDRPQDSFGLCFGPSRQFSTRFGPNLKLFHRTGTLVNQDWTWAEAWADLGLRPTLDDLGLRLGPILMSSVETRQMSQQKTVKKH